MIKSADYVIDLGLEGGAKGGNLVAQGTPEELIKHSESYTAQFLANSLWFFALSGRNDCSALQNQGR